MARHLAAYDISHEKTRTKVAAVLSEFGYRLQWSVFEIDTEDLSALRRRIGALLSQSVRRGVELGTFIKMLGDQAMQADLSEMQR